MRIVAYILAFLAVLAVANLAASVAYSPYRDYIRTLRGEVANEKTPTTQAKTSTSGSTSDEQLIASLEQMNAWLAALVSTGSTQTPKEWTGSVKVSVTQSGVIKSAEEYPLSGLLLSRLMPDIFPKKIENKGIFDIHIFSSLGYSTYQDAKTKAKFYAFAESYEVMLSNLKLVTSVYTIKETDTFFGSTFFLNSTNKKDSSIRFVIALEGKAIGIEIPKSFYPKMKLLLKK